MITREETLKMLDELNEEISNMTDAEIDDLCLSKSPSYRRDLINTLKNLYSNDLSISRENLFLKGFETGLDYAKYFKDGEIECLKEKN